MGPIFDQACCSPPYGSANAQTKLTLVEYVYRNSILYSRDPNYHLQAAGFQATRDMNGKIALENNLMVNNFYWDGQYYVWNGFSSQINASIDLSLGGRYGPLGASATVGYSISFPESKYKGSTNLKTLYPSGGTIQRMLSKLSLNPKIFF